MSEVGCGPCYRRPSVDIGGPGWVRISSFVIFAVTNNPLPLGCREHREKKKKKKGNLGRARSLRDNATADSETRDSVRVGRSELASYLGSGHRGDWCPTLKFVVILLPTVPPYQGHVPRCCAYMNLVWRVPKGSRLDGAPSPSTHVHQGRSH